MTNMTNDAIFNSVLSVASLFVGIIGIYYLDNKSINFGHKYRHLYGNYKLYNFSRSRIMTDNAINLIVWDVCISMRWFKIPYFTMIYTDTVRADQNVKYSGDIIIDDQRMIVRLKSSVPSQDFPSLGCIVFKRPSDTGIQISIGFLAGFRDPTVPYCGVQVMGDASLSESEARYILGSIRDLWFEDYNNRIDHVLNARKNQHFQWKPPFEPFGAWARNTVVVDKKTSNTEGSSPGSAGVAVAV